MGYQERVEGYLNIGGKYGPANYFLNKEHKLLSRRVLIGRGSPDEIAEMADKGYFDKVGIDCTGLICHILEGESPIKSILN